jgi:hypothetical protein
MIPGEERRRSQRVMIRVPVTLQMTISGQKVVFQGVTESVNDHGAMVVCKRPVAAGAEVDLLNDRTQQKQSCRVTRTPTESGATYLIPLEFVSPTPGFWHISFPPADWKPAT